MLEMTLQQQRSASKRLSKLKLSFGDNLMQLDTYWCRIAFDAPESDILHHHSFFEIHYFIEGSADFIFSDGSYLHLNQGETLLIPPRCEHKIINNSKSCKKFVFAFFISFNPEHPDSKYFEQIHHISSPVMSNATDAMEFLANSLLQYTYEMKPTSVLSINYALRLFFCELASLILPESPTIETTSKNNKYVHHRDLVDNIHFYISNNIDKTITGKNVAEQFNISLQQLNRILLLEDGCTISQLITNQRTQLIRSLLENTNFPLKQIASRTGFSNEYNMSRFFKREEGISPGLYRKSLYDHKI